MYTQILVECFRLPADPKQCIEEWEHYIIGKV